MNPSRPASFCRSSISLRTCPGNFRELEQCVRNILVRKTYQPAATGRRDAADELAADIRTAALTSDELLRRYYRIVYAQEGSYLAAADRLGVDRRTVQKKLNAAD
jgi:transcriptional regulator of acetoin/glycerol metabolism